MDWTIWIWIVVCVVSIILTIKLAKFIIDEIVIMYEMHNEIGPCCPYYNRLCGKCIRKPFSRKGKKECEEKKAMFQNAIKSRRVAHHDDRPPCPECHGTGRYNGVCCDRCGGTGKLLV